MQIQQIDKATYRSHLNRVIWAAIILLLVVSLGSSTLLIMLMGDPNGSNFGLNVVGVVLGVVVVFSLFTSLRSHPYMAEIDYVLRLKHELNLIYRKMNKVKRAVEKEHLPGLIAMQFYLTGMKQLLTLDDNDLTMPELNKDTLAFAAKVDELGVSINADEYNRTMLSQLDD